MKILRSCILVAAAALVLGAAVNVGIALWVGRHSISNAAAWSGGSIGEWPAAGRAGWPAGAIRADRIEGCVREIAAWPVFDGWNPSVLPEMEPWQRVYESGWPWPAIRASVTIPRARLGEAAPAQMPRAESGRSYRPIWPGIAYGAVFFGVLRLAAMFAGWALLFQLGPWALSLVWRSRRKRICAAWRSWCIASLGGAATEGDGGRPTHERRAGPPRLGDAVAIAWRLSPRRSWQRLPALLAGGVIGGLILTVLVSWTCALWPRGFVFQGFGKPMVIEQWGATFTSERVPSPSPAGYNEALQVHTGWPWRTFRWTAENAVWSRWAPRRGPNPTPAGIVREGIELPRFFADPNLNERRIPLDPISGGLARSVPLYSVVAILLLVLLGYLRRGVRVRRGQCPACAYPVGPSEVCTECGLKLTMDKRVPGEPAKHGRGGESTGDRDE